MKGCACTPPRGKEWLLQCVCVWAVNDAWVIHWTLSCPLLQGLTTPPLGAFHYSCHDWFITNNYLGMRFGEITFMSSQIAEHILYCFFVCLCFLDWETGDDCNTSNFSNQEPVINHLINFTHTRFSPYSTCENEEPRERQQILKQIFFFFFYARKKT